MSKRILCVILMLLCVVTALTITPTAVTVQSSRTYRCCDSSGAYSVRCSGTHVDISRCSTRTMSAGLELSYSVTGICVCRGRIVLLCSDTKNSQLIVYVYHLDTDDLESFAVYDTAIYADTDFCCGDNAVFIENDKNNKELKAYSFSGNQLGTYRFDGEITDVFCGYDAGVFVVGSHTLYAFSGGGFTAVSDSYVQPHLFAVDSHILSSETGEIYVLDQGRVARTFSVETNNAAASSCVVGDRLYYPCGSVINGYDIDTGERVCYYRLAYGDPLLFADGNSIIAVNGTSAQKIAQGDFTELYTPSADNSSASGGSRPSSGNQSTNGAVSAISSDVYQVDLVNFRITGISPGTTVAAFKANMHHSGYSVAVFRENTEKKSGSVGTAMTAVFTANNSRYSFELSVIGDITGEGNRNSRDLNLLMDYLTGAATFDGVYEIAADLSGDHTVNAVDLAMLKSMI